MAVRRRTAHVLAFGLLTLLIYLPTANYNGTLVSDTVAVAVPVWSVVERGTVDVRPHQDMSPWFFEQDGRYISNRWPGTMLVALPAYVLASPWVSNTEPAMWPATVAAAILTAMAVTLFFALFWLEHGPWTAWPAGMVFAFGTGMWTVAADSLWTHGPAVLLIGATLLALRARRDWLAGVCLGFVALVRLHLLAAAAIVGYVVARERRDLWVLVRMGVPAALGLAAYVVYVRQLTGSVGLGVLPYALVPPEGWGRVINVAGVLVSPRVGLLIYTPMLMVCLPGLRTAWRLAADWERAAFFGGVVYLVVQVQTNYFFGGYSFYSYRLPLEALAFAAPLLVRSTVHALEMGGNWRRWMAAAAGAYSIWVHAVGAVWFNPEPDERLAPWSVYAPVEALSTAGAGAVASAAVLATVVAAVVYALARVATRLKRRPRADAVA